jgi:hypothetical protein
MSDYDLTGASGVAPGTPAFSPGLSPELQPGSGVQETTSPTNATVTMLVTTQWPAPGSGGTLTFYKNATYSLNPDISAALVAAGKATSV